MSKKYVAYITGIGLVLGALILIGWRRRAANTAAEFIDTMEIGHNAGFVDKAFENMMRSIGWRGGEAWCMYFAKYIWMLSFPKKADEINSVLTGSTQGSWKAAQQHPDLFKVITDGVPRKGDIAIWQSTTNTSLGHAAIVYKKDSDDYWETVEGNSGFGGTREGEGVTKGRRKLVPGTVDGGLKLLGFIRLKS